MNPSNFEELISLKKVVSIPDSLFTRVKYVDGKTCFSASREKIEAHLLCEHYKEKKEKCELIEKYGNLESGFCLSMSAFNLNMNEGKPCLTITKREAQLAVAKKRKIDADQKAWEEKQNNKS